MKISRLNALVATVRSDDRQVDRYGAGAVADSVRHVWRCLKLFATVFTLYNCLRAAAMQEHISEETRVDCHKTKESSAHILYHMKERLS